MCFFRPFHGQDDEDDMHDLEAANLKLMLLLKWHPDTLAAPFGCESRWT